MAWSEIILWDLGLSLIVSLIVFAVLRYFKKFDGARALKISAVVFAATATIIGLIVLWLVNQSQPIMRAMYGVEVDRATASCLQQCEQIADKASDAFRNCINACG